MKKKILLVAVLSMLCINGCTKAIVNDTASNSNIVESSQSTLLDMKFKKSFNSVRINEEEVVFPVEYNKFIELGFFDYTETSFETIKGKPALTTFTDETGTISAYLGFKGKGDKGYKMDSDVISIFASRDNIGEIDISFYGDITFDSTEEDVSKVLDLLQKDEDNSLYGIKMGEYSYLAVSFQNSKVNDVMMINGEDYFK